MKRTVIIEPTDDTPPAIRVFVKQGRKGRSFSKLFAEGESTSDNVNRAVLYASGLVAQLCGLEVPAEEAQPSTPPATEAPQSGPTLGDARFLEP